MSVQRLTFGQRIGNRAFDFFVYLIVILAVLLCLVPIFHEVSVSLSSNAAIVSQQVRILPVGLNLESYKMVLTDTSVIRSMFYTVYITVMYTLFSMAMTVCCAYPFAHKDLMGRNFFMTVMIITMFFSGGMIPGYLLLKDLHMLDTTWSLILPGVLSAFNVIIMKTFFNSFPESLTEAARLDGCGELRILLSIVLPLSTPVLATLSLFYAVGRWNGFSDALLYISNPKLQPMPLKLYNIVYNSMNINTIQQEEGFKNFVQPAADALKAATVMVATIPIVLVYPWLQKYFVKGVMIGAIKE